MAVISNPIEEGDPDCLHCQIGQLIFAIPRRGEESQLYVISNLCQNLGEFIAANAPPGKLDEWTAAVQERLKKEVDSAAAAFRAAGKRSRLSDG